MLPHLARTLAHVNQGPRRLLDAGLESHFDERGARRSKLGFQRALKLLRLFHAPRGDAEAIRQPHEIRISKARADRSTAELQLLVAQHVRERVVVEYDGHEVD